MYKQMHSPFLALGKDYLGVEDPTDVVGALVGLFMCILCRRCFDRAVDLVTHYRHTNHNDGAVPREVEHLHTMPGLKTRNRRSWRYKRDRVMEYLDYRRDPLKAPYAQSLVAHQCGVDLGTIGRWIKDKERIFQFARTPGLGSKLGFQPWRPKWPRAELRLYARFIYRRRVQAKRVTRRWLARNLTDIRRNLGHTNMDANWLPSEGYLTRFCKRWCITSQCRTNKKKQSVEERLSVVQAFHQYWVDVIQHRQPQRDQKYGRYPPDTIYAMDQVPMAFSSPNKRTLSEKGAPNGCRLLGIIEDDKRFCTLNVTLCANPHSQDVAIEVVFRGLGPENGGRVSQEELDFYAAHPNVKVRWQSKAWADHRICLDYLLDFTRGTLLCLWTITEASKHL